MKTIKYNQKKIDIAVMADIHGNALALKACVEHALDKGVTHFFFLGDYLGECGNPAETMKILYGLKEKYHCWFVKGNKEDAWLGFVKDEGCWLEYGNSITGTMLYLYERRTEGEKMFFEQLPIAQKIDIEGLPSITICHGSPMNNNQPMKVEIPETFEIMNQCDTDMILYGHTHRRRIIEHEGKVAYNPGAVGAPLESGGKAQYLLLHGEQGCWKVKYCDLEYDIEETIQKLHKEGLSLYAPNWCKITEALLRTGEVTHSRVLQNAMELCKEETGICNWPHIPEVYMEKSLQMFGIY